MRHFWWMSPDYQKSREEWTLFINFIRKTDEEYLTYLDELASKDKIPFMEYCINAIENHREPERLFITEIGLGNFDDIDVQRGFTFNTQLFKVDTNNIMDFLKGDQ